MNFGLLELAFLMLFKHSEQVIDVTVVSELFATLILIFKNYSILVFRFFVLGYSEVF